VVFGFLYTDLSYFLVRVQGISEYWLGATIAIMAISLVVASIPLGIASDRYGRRKMLIFGNIAASLSLIGFALTTSIPLILFSGVVEGLGEAAFAVSVTALLTDKAGDHKRTVAFSLAAFLGWISGAVGGFAISSALALERVGLSVGQSHVAIYLIVGLLSLSITPLITRVKDTRTYTPVKGERRGFLPRKSGRVLGKFLFYSILIALGAGLFVPLMTLWFSHRYGVPDTISGPVLGVSGFLTAVAVFLSPRLARKLGLVRAIVVTQGLATLFMAFVPNAPTFETSATIYTVRVFMMNLSNPLAQSLIMGLVSPDERGMASGVTASLWRLPNALSSFVGAAWIGMGLLALPFYVATVLYVAAITVLWFLFKSARLPEEERDIAQPVAVLVEEEPTVIAAK
jgi:MFS family permease